MAIGAVFVVGAIAAWTLGRMAPLVAVRAGVARHSGHLRRIFALALRRQLENGLAYPAAVPVRPSDGGLHLSFPGGPMGLVAAVPDPSIRNAACQRFGHHLLERIWHAVQ